MSEERWLPTNLLQQFHMPPQVSGWGIFYSVLRIHVNLEKMLLSWSEAMVKQVLVMKIHKLNICLCALSATNSLPIYSDPANKLIPKCLIFNSFNACKLRSVAFVCVSILFMMGLFLVSSFKHDGLFQLTLCSLTVTKVGLSLFSPCLGRS